ncbi:MULTISPECIES: hydroxyphenylacetyl-CoA thioesterase PaaI [Mumia]|uniref:hydroxyphenylacetyl-CoA thioesterase PaaI n=1 Tax=Mumia TaxID=1546255 RepID=UPI001421C76A|nr:MULTISPECIES: hydroxyphenylacetyl-CoA thioesterase PaaI [unclassified Mumia]QMW66471.1 hydroxyphenylacetyl-CoA thioesterase PaaI [Mumia sp. ZJ1417]
MTGDGAAAMWAADAASRALGMECEHVARGEARVSMVVRDDMVNGHGLCHGGLVAALADSTFALACNGYGEVTVAAGFDITFLAPAHLGDTLVAEAVERARSGRSGLYDVTVRRRPDEATIAEFRGRSRGVGPVSSS